MKDLFVFILNTLKNLSSTDWLFILFIIVNAIKLDDINRSIRRIPDELYFKIKNKN